MVASAAATAMSTPMLATADSDLQVGAPGATQAQANLDFLISIPTYIYFQIGDNVLIDTVDFDLTTGPTTPGSGAVAATSSVNVILRTNATTLNISASGADLQNADGDIIPITDITETGGGTEIPHPGDFVGTSVPFNPTNTDIATDNTETWSFSFANTTAYPPGVYGDGSGVNGQTVTYTVADF
jgi:hypothetical protein